MSKKTDVPAGHVRVRIAVAVDPTGAWLAHGGDLASAEDSKKEIAFNEERDAFYWIEADLPLPNGPRLGLPRVVRER